MRTGSVKPSRDGRRRHRSAGLCGSRSSAYAWHMTTMAARVTASWVGSVVALLSCCGKRPPEPPPFDAGIGNDAPADVRSDAQSDGDGDADARLLPPPEGIELAAGQGQPFSMAIDAESVYW